MNYISALFSGSNPKDQGFMKTWQSLISSLVGRWGRGTWKPFENEKSTYIVTKDICYFSFSPIVRGFVTMKLPFYCADTGILFILSDGNLTAKPIFMLDDEIELNLTGNSIILTSHYEAISK